MKIGLVTTWFERGAAMVSRAYRDVLAKDHEVYIYARGGEEYAQGDPNWDHDYVTWGRRTRGYQATAVNWSDFKAWATRLKLDVILFNEQNYWPTVVLARRELPCLLGSYVDYYTSVTVPFFKLYDFLLCNTRRHYRVFQDHPAALYIPWGTDLSIFQGNDQRVDPQRLVFFHSAGMNPDRKGTGIAVDAFRGLDADCRLILHVQADLRQYPKLKKACDEDPRITVLNQTVSAPGLYHLGDVYVYPTILEGIGLTIAEALACGLPVITTDVPPMNEFIQPAENGALVPASEYRGRSDGYYWAESYCSAADVREAMQFYMDRASQLADLKIRARRYAEDHFDWQKNASDLGQWISTVKRVPRDNEASRILERKALTFSGTFGPHKRLLQFAAQRIRFMRTASWDRYTYG